MTNTCDYVEPVVEMTQKIIDMAKGYQLDARDPIQKFYEGLQTKRQQQHEEMHVCSISHLVSTEPERYDRLMQERLDTGMSFALDYMLFER